MALVVLVAAVAVPPGEPLKRMMMMKQRAFLAVCALEAA